MSEVDVQATPVREGDVLAGKYRVERVLGAGGMGVVVAAMHLELDQRVAVKFLLPEALANAAAVERFAREARAAVRLKSEHVARVIDVGKLAHGAPYIVMEYLDGADLATMLERHGALPVDVAVWYLLQACEAVAEAHALGIVHRDLKPRNLFLTKKVDGQPLVKVLDFGISKVTDPRASAPNMSLTRTAEVMGSPMYMSPEQLRSARDVDERTDIWALGVILYELLTGIVPFEATTVTALCAMVLEDVPREASELRPEVPQGLSEVIKRCLAKPRDQRFASVADLAEALEPFAPSTSRGAGVRIKMVGIESQPRSIGPSSLPISGPVSSRVSVSGGTSVSWGETELAGSPSKRSRKIVVGASALIGVVALVAIAGIVARSAGSTSATRPDPTPTPVASSAPTSELIVGGAMPPTAPTLAAVPKVAASQAPSATTTLLKLTKPPPPTTATTTTTPPATTTAATPATTTPRTPAASGRPKDDMPSERH